MHLFGKKREKGTTLILHIGSSTVDSTVIRHWKDGKIEVLAHSRIPTNFLLDVDFQAFWRVVKKSFEISLEKLQENFTGRPDSVVCVFTSPWFISQTKIATIEREEGFLVDEKLFNKLVENEIEIFLRHWQGKMDPLQGKASLIEYKIIKVNLNGYRTQKPLGKTVKSLEAYIYISLGVSEAMEAIKKEVNKIFGRVPIQFHTFPFITFNVLGAVMNTDEGLLFVEIGGEATDVSVVRKNILEETISFRRGKNNLIRKISSEMKTFIEEVPSVLEAYNTEKLNPASMGKINKLVDESMTDWLSLFKESLKMISENFPLPQNILIIGDHIIQHEVTKRIEGNTDLAQYTVFEKPFSITRIRTPVLEDFFSNRKFFDDQKDIFLSLEAIFADRFNNTEEKPTK